MDNADADWLRSLAKYLQSLIRAGKGTLFLDSDIVRLNRIADTAKPDPEAARLRTALEHLFEFARIYDPDDWQGEPAMIEAAQVLGKPPFDDNPLTEAEMDELVQRINANPNLRPLPGPEAKLAGALNHARECLKANHYGDQEPVIVEIDAALTLLAREQAGGAPNA